MAEPTRRGDDRRPLPELTEIPPPLTRWWIWAVYLALFGLSVPWYLPGATPVRLWLGLPYWVVISLAASFAVAAFTALVAVRYWTDRPPDPVALPKVDT